MINFKQEELIQGMMATLKAKYPEVDLVETREGPEDPNTLWVCVTTFENEDREIEFRELAAEKCVDVLLDYGYHLLVMPICDREAA